MMGREREIKDAIQQCEDEQWQCATCSAPAEENGQHCMSCRIYWQDVGETFGDEPEGEDAHHA